MKSTIVLIITLCSFLTSNAQYLFSGYAEDDSINNTAYLSVIDDYRKVSGVHEEQIISKVKVDSSFFMFKGNNLDVNNKIYRIHIDNCNDFDKNHYNGKCDTSREIIFIATNKDTISLPISLNNQMLCDIQSSNKHSNVFFKIDSLKELMAYDYSTDRTEEAIEVLKLNTKLFPEKPEVFVSLANTFYSTDNKKEVLVYYEKGFKLNPNSEKLKSTIQRLKTEL